MRFTPYVSAAAERILALGEPMEIRRSSAAAFNFSAVREQTDDRMRYANEHTVLDAPRRCVGGDRFSLAVSGGSTFQVIDFLRDLALRHEEHRGAVVLHAAAVRDGDGDSAVAIAGAKGAGKTTTLLACLAVDRWRYFTGDKLLCRPVDGGIEAHPWRDVPYVGAGTLRDHPALARRVGDATGHDARPPASR